jgi:hypothetical protein
MTPLMTPGSRGNDCAAAPSYAKGGSVSTISPPAESRKSLEVKLLAFPFPCDFAETVPRTELRGGCAATVSPMSGALAMSGASMAADTREGAL